MAIREVLTYPNEILRKTCKSVEKFDASLNTLIQDMLDTMYDAPGVGLAAIQVGELIRLLVLDVEYDIEESEDGAPIYRNKTPLVLINPVILEKKGKYRYKEGCLSVPGIYEEVDRFLEIKVQYQNENGEKKELIATELKAVAIQHEMDHLDGKLFIDRLGLAKQTLVKNRLKKGSLLNEERSRYKVEF